MTSGKDLPYLQDTNEVDAQGVWDAHLRDLIILNPANEPVDTTALNPKPDIAPNLNLTIFDLADAGNRAALKALLLSAATLRDADGDGLCDYWEDAEFGGDRSTGPDDDPDRDGASTLLEYAHGSDPADPASRPALEGGLTSRGGARHLQVSFRRRLGAAGGLHYAVEAGDTLDAWAGGPTQVIEVSRINPYDGTGTEMVTFRAVQEVSTREFLRVTCTLP